MILNLWDMFGRRRKLRQKAPQVRGFSAEVQLLEARALLSAAPVIAIHDGQVVITPDNALPANSFYKFDVEDSSCNGVEIFTNDGPNGDVVVKNVKSVKLDDSQMPAGTTVLFTMDAKQCFLSEGSPGFLNLTIGGSSNSYINAGSGGSLDQFGDIATIGTSVNITGTGNTILLGFNGGTVEYQGNVGHDLLAFANGTRASLSLGTGGSTVDVDSDSGEVDITGGPAVVNAHVVNGVQATVNTDPNFVETVVLVNSPLDRAALERKLACGCSEYEHDHEDDHSDNDGHRSLKNGDDHDKTSNDDDHHDRDRKCS